MEANKEVVEKLILQSNKVMQKYNITFLKYTNTLKTTTTINSTMLSKAELLKDTLLLLPLNDIDCYFCQIAIPYTCSQCKYSKLHSICSESNSSYSNIVKAKKALLNTIGSIYYYPNEDTRKGTSIDKNIITTLRENFTKTAHEITKLFKLYQVKLTYHSHKTLTVESIMEAKKSLLLSILKRFPFTQKHCYYCLENKNSNNVTDCYGCHYSLCHAECTTPSSDYAIIKSAITDLAQALRKYYFKGEEY